MIELFFALYKLVAFAAINRWYDDIGAGKVSPFKVSLVYFLLGISMFLLMFVSSVETSKIVHSGFGCHAILIAMMYLITNDHEEYHKGAGVWIAWLTRCIVLTGLLTLAMDYSNTKTTFNSFFIGYAAATVPDMLKRKIRNRVS